jgi:hypothetical protein
MLRSPLASARLPPPASMLAPAYGRPRSRTAPSTPLVEAPAHTLVELPGSIPDRPRASYHHSYDSKLRQPLRPTSHAKRPSHPWLHFTSDSKNDRAAENHRNSTPPQYVQPSTPQQQPSEGLMASTRKFSKPTAHPRRIWSDPLQSRGTLQPVPSTPRREAVADCHTSEPSIVSMATGNNHRISYDTSHHSYEQDSRSAHACSLQASHEAHLAALTEAHRREIASLHVYIEQLGPCRGLVRTSEVHTHPSMRQYADHQKFGIYNSAETWRSAPTRHRKSQSQSFPANHANTTIDPHCTSLAGCGEIWLECNHLRNTLETTSTRLSQSEDTIRRMQGVEKSLKATIENLRSRLQAANNERLDVQEGFHNACCRVRGFAERETSLIHELEELQKFSSQAVIAGQCYEEMANLQELHHQRPISPGTNSTTTSHSRAQSHPPSLSPSSRSPSPSALGISIPQTPRTTAEALLVTTESPSAYTLSRTPLLVVHKELPPPAPPFDTSPMPARLRRAETTKSVGESIIELYAGPENDDGWERGWCADGVDEVGGRGWVEWV